MRKLPPRPITQLSTPQRERLSAWLYEWEVELQLRKMDGDASLAQLPEGAMNGTPLDEPVCVGEIRLLAPHLQSPGQRPVYVLVVSKWDNDWKLVTPFSQFPLPATQGELLTLRSEGPWQVLQVWNSRTLPNEVIAESWVADTASESLLDEAWAVFRHFTFGAALPDELTSRIGPPVLQPHDPRISYQKMETALLSGLAREAFKEAEQLNQTVAAADSNELALAASTEISPASAENLVFGELGASIKLSQQTGRRGIYRAKVLNDPSKELAGAKIISTDNETLATFKEGSGITKGVLVTDQFRATLNNLKLLRIRLQDGSILTQRSEH